MIKRYLASVLEQAGKDTPAVFLRGARQTGKSTLVKQIVAKTPGAAYYTMDDWDMLSAARQNPMGFIAGLPAKAAIDEIQRAPELLLPIKAEIDRNRRPGRFILTGSANVLVLPRVSDTLAGRIEVLTLWPFSQGELAGEKETFIDAVFSGAILDKTPLRSFKDAGGILKRNTAPAAVELCRNMVAGGYPEVLARKQPSRRNAWFKSYIETIIQRDILELAKIEGLRYIPDLLHLLAGRCAGLLSFSDLSRSLQMPQSSLKRYFALLEAAFLIYRVPSWHGNFITRFIKSPKVYCNDTGLASYLLGVDAKRLENDQVLAGRLCENFVVNELHKQASWSKTCPMLYHFRSHDGQEVDSVLENRQGQCVGIEIKSSTSVSPGDAKGLRYLKDQLGKRFLRGVVLYNGTRTVPFDDRIHAVPISSLWG
jgi:predicted AAA+ superfamily ATPase